MRQTHFSWLSFLNWTPVTFNNALVNFWGPRHWNFGRNYFKMNFVTLLIFSAVLHWAVRRLFILSIGIFRLNGCKPQNNKTFTLPTPYQQHLWAIEIHFEFPIKAFASLSFRSKFIYWLLWSTTSGLIYVKQFWKLQRLDFAKPALKNKWSKSTNWSTLSFSTEHQLRDLKDLRGILSNRSRVSPKEGAVWAWSLSQYYLNFHLFSATGPSTTSQHVHIQRVRYMKRRFFILCWIFFMCCSPLVTLQWQHENVIDNMKL